MQGLVRFTLTGEGAEAVLVSEDGVEAPWVLSFFETQPVLRNAAFDVYDFVHIS